MTDAPRLDSLPFDVLIIIFDYCHAFDLVRLSEVCVRFRDIVRGETLWLKKSKQPLATNQASKRFCQRCNPLLCLRTKWHTSNNWQCGKYAKRVLLFQEKRVMPWVQLTRDYLWWSGGYNISGFRRSLRPPRLSYKWSNHKSLTDICKFIVRREFLICGHRNGSLHLWRTHMSGNKNEVQRIYKAHLCDVNALDETPYVFISGSADGRVKIWRPINEGIEDVPLTTMNVADKIWSLAANSIGTKFAVGSTGNGVGPPLRIYDIECYSECDIMEHNWRRGAGILDMIWDNPQILLTCGYDTYIRKWDMRIGACVSSWSDPTDATIYCISTDFHHTMVTGTQYNCKAVLWDQRQRHCVQLYFLDEVSSPVYSIAFDSSHLYGATDRHLVELKFSGYSYPETDYREIFRY
ncbi:hypothetical protein KM043_001166 [Ampulex compressa]|nr:hypothetical protein KM043_001166 [Ampulex compressa]